MLVAHVSDLHVRSAENAPWYRFLNKRLTGYANLRFRRHAVHREGHLRAVLRGVREIDADHIVITGDLTNLALEFEFDRARAIIEEELNAEPERISIIPGNHDTYTSGAERTHRFDTFFGRYATSDLSEYGVDLGPGRFPFVRLRGPLAIIGLSSAVAQPPLVAAGVLGKTQRNALQSILAHPEVQSRSPLLLLHHPPRNPISWAKSLMEGLHDAHALADILRTRSGGVVLHGHLHRRIQHILDFETAPAQWRSIGATSASLQHDDTSRMAGFNLYTFDDGGHLTHAEARVLDFDHSDFTVTSIPNSIAERAQRNHPTIAAQTH